MKQAKIIIGLGTGRCGTQSLAKLLNQQPEVYCTHETPPVLPWKTDKKLWEDRLEYLNSEKKGIQTIGEVSFYYLPYIPDFLQPDLDIKFVCMKRDKESTINSYLKKTKGRNHWMEHDRNAFWKEDALFDPCYPKYEISGSCNSEEKAENLKRKALELYWEEYYEKAGSYAQKHPDVFRVFDMQELNLERGVRSILSFCGIEERKQKVAYIRELSDS